MMDARFPDIRIRAATNEDIEEIKVLVFGVLLEYGWKGDSAATDADLNDIEESYIKPGGIFEVLEDTQGRMLGTVGLYPLSAEVCELRKMYFIPEIRGKGLGRHLFERTIENARKLGFKRIELETARVLKEAQRLYVKNGFKPLIRKEISCRCDQAYYLDL
jgi:putative acetyltransferase